MKAEQIFTCPVCSRHSHTEVNEMHPLELLMMKMKAPEMITSKKPESKEAEVVLDMITQEPCAHCMSDLGYDEMYVVEHEDNSAIRQTGVTMKVDRELLRSLCYDEMVDHDIESTEESRHEFVAKITHPKWHYMFTSIENMRYFHEKLGEAYPIPSEI